MNEGEINMIENKSSIFLDMNSSFEGSECEDEKTGQPIKLKCYWSGCSSVFDTFNDWESFKSFEGHVVEHGHLAAIGHQNEYEILHELTCMWVGCTWALVLPKNDDTLHYIKKHLCEHAHHARLISVGESYAKKCKLQTCQIQDKFIPAFQTCFSCEWIPCEFANHRYETPMLFYSHVRSHATWSSEFKHKKVVEYACCWKDCELKFSNRHRLNVHLRHHTWEKRIACYTCGSCFVSSTKLRHHLYRQSKLEVGDFTCHICSKKFGDKNFFNEHVQLHERPFKCTLCEYSCGIKSNLKRHITFRHSDFRSFNCTLCDKSYKCSNDLSRHVKSHINTEPLKCKKEKKLYGCHICKSTFVRGYNVTRHLVDIHCIKNSLNVKSMFEKNEDGIYYLSEEFR